jgi:hypothetical protein
MENNIEKYKKRFFILMESSMGDVKPLLSEQEKIVKNYDTKYDYKKEGGNYYYKLKNSNDWILSKGSGLESIKTKVFKDTPIGITDKKSQISKMYDDTKLKSDYTGPGGSFEKNLYGKDKEKLTKVGTDNKKVADSDYDCISVSKEQCKKISPNSETKLDKSEETRCTSYARKCLSQYGLDYLGGSAWEALRYLKSRGGKEKYNMFNNLDYSNLENNIKKIGKNYKSICDTCFKPKDGTNINVDNECDSNKLGKTISDFYPSSSSIDLGSLELGDIVGIYWAGSGNKGKAFCQKASIDDKNAITNKNTTINTHLGFVGAIKNGEPIIFHNVHGQHYATPAKNYISKPSKEGGMITWVISDPELKSNLSGDKKPEEKGVWEKMKNYFK